MRPKKFHIPLFIKLVKVTLETRECFQNQKEKCIQNAQVYILIQNNSAFASRGSCNNLSKHGQI